MASRYRSISRPAINLLKSTVTNPCSKPVFALQSPRSSSSSFSWPLLQMGALQSLLPLHSAISPAKLTSCLGADTIGCRSLSQERICPRNFIIQGASHVLNIISFASTSKKVLSTIPRCSGSSNLNSGKDESSIQNKTPFGYTRKDVLLIGLGVTLAGIGLKSGLEYVGVDPLQAGNVVQLVLVLGLTVGWISTYIFRVSNKEMTYAQQLRDYEIKVMEKRLDSLTEAEIQALLEQVEEEKRRMAGGEQVK